MDRDAITNGSLPPPEDVCFDPNEEILDEEELIRLLEGVGKWVRVSYWWLIVISAVSGFGIVLGIVGLL